MKSRRRRAQNTAKTPAIETPKKAKVDSTRTPAGPTGSQQWLFRLVAFTIVPLVCLGALELALRLAGYGYPTRFFRAYKAADREILVENDQFARKFFPSRLLRRPAPFVLDARKKEGTYRIFVFGESAAMGDPDPSFSFSRILEVMLRERYAGAQFEVVNLAFTAINSHVILPIARDAAAESGDLWIIYMGNNEVTGPFGPATVFGSPSPNVNLVRAGIALKGFKTGQILQSLSERARSGSSKSNSWTGLQMFVANQISQTDPRMEKVYSHFERNLHDILRQGRRSGAKILVSTVASNLKDCAPFASVHSKPLSQDQEAEWKSGFEKGIKAETAGQFGDAIAHYLKTAQIDPGFAELHFRLGRCYLADNQLEQARTTFELARDLDALRFRADSRLNSILTNSAAAWSTNGVILVDAKSALVQSSVDGNPGDEFFFDHVHLNYDGNYLLALTIAGEVAKLLPREIAQRDTGNWIASSVCARRLALTGWDQYRIYELMERRLLEPPFTTQSNHASRRQRYLQKLVALRPTQQFGALDEAANIYNEALERAPKDFQLHENFARLLFARSDLDGALNHNKLFARLLPHHPAPYYNQALVLNAQGRSDDAVKLYDEALRRRPDYAEAFHGLGVIRRKEGRLSAAQDLFSRALELRPDYVEALLNLGDIWEKENQIEKAKEFYFRALSVQSNSFAVRLRVGNALIASGDLLEATKHHAEAVRLQPRNAMAHFSELVQLQSDNPIAHFQLANAWAAQDQRAEATQSLRDAIALKPDFWQARYLLGVELAVQNNIAEAAAEFAEVIRTRPDFAPAHFNLGVALAKAGRLNEAAGQFAETLRLDPKHQSAQQYLNNLRPLIMNRR